MMTVRETARTYGLSEGFVRDACHRGAKAHRLPHVECGAKRPIIRISGAVFERWLREEMGLEELEGMDGGGR